MYYRSKRSGNSSFSSRNSRRRNFGSRPYLSRNRKNKPKKEKIDPAKFISKATGLAKKELSFAPRNKFSDFNIDSRIKRNIESRGYIDPMPIQDEAIPHILEGRDLIGIANTGTGKTAAMLIPLIEKALKNRSEKVLIITPTRELAFQIEDEFRGFARGLGMWSVSCIGGANVGRQIFNLRRDHNFVIGTPGRLKFLTQRRILNLSSFRNVVLDEVDRMFDIGFINEVKNLLSQLSKERQSLFFSATVSEKIKELINDFLKDPVTVSVKTGETAVNVEQDVIKIRNGYHEKIEVLNQLLSKEEFKKVLIFGKTKIGVERLSGVLYKRGFKVESIHGDKDQRNRQKALNLFKMDHISILVATDVAARGLDISNVSHVINFDLPNTYEDYIHRIGRTGRANKKGYAFTFVE